MFSFPDKTLLPCCITRGPNSRNFSLCNRSFSGVREERGPGRQLRTRHDDRFPGALSSRSPRQSKRSRAKGRMQTGGAGTGSPIGPAAIKSQRPLLSGRVIRLCYTRTSLPQESGMVMIRSPLSSGCREGQTSSFTSRVLRVCVADGKFSKRVVQRPPEGLALLGRSLSADKGR